MDLGLTGKRALITGSSSGIGAGIATMLAKEGVCVVVHGRDHARTAAIAGKIAAAGGKVESLCGDLTLEADAVAVADGALAAFGGIDILVNNAGGSRPVADPSWFSMGIEDWSLTYASNVLASVRLIHRLVPDMKERGWGRVINIATGAAITPTSAQPDYGAAKAAMLNLSLGLSKALSQSGVTSNAISPGMIHTDGLQSFLTKFAAKRGWGDDIERAAEYVAKGSGQTVKRIGEIDDIAYMVTMLASPRCDFVNGANLHVDGGISPSLC
jgi:3-oxoacyl-[acyl-carrier protein] reductase